MPKTKKYNKKSTRKTIKTRKTRKTRKIIKKGGAITTNWLLFESNLINKQGQQNKVLYSIDYTPITNSNEELPFEYFIHGVNSIAKFKANNIIFDNDNNEIDEINMLKILNENISKKKIVIKFSNEIIKTSETDNQYELSKSEACADYVCKLYDYGSISKPTIKEKEKPMYKKMYKTMYKWARKFSTPVSNLHKMPEINYNKYLLIEDCGTDLFYYTIENFTNKEQKNSHQLIETFIKQLNIVNDMLLGLQCIHKTINRHYYIHGDIKLENIVIHDNPNPTIIKYIDFGHSEKVEEGKRPKGKLLGTKHYYAPEKIYKTPALIQSKESDIWSLGFTILMFLFNTEFYPVPETNSNHKPIRNTLYRPDKFPIQSTYYNINKDENFDDDENMDKLQEKIKESFDKYYFANFKKVKEDVLDRAYSNEYLKKYLNETSIYNLLYNFFKNLLHYNPDERNLDEAIINFTELLKLINSIDKEDFSGIIPLPNPLPNLEYLNNSLGVFLNPFRN
jgi:serine/threonine protein kinase